MSEPLTVITEPVESVQAETELDLPWLHQQCMSIGRPFYHCHESGTWSVRLHVPVPRAGCTAEVHSGFDHATLTAAMRAVLRAASGEDSA